MNQAWLTSKKLDLSLLFLPVWLTWLLCFLLPQKILDKDLSLELWVVFVLGIDVTHVWSTLWRTYLSSDDRQNHKTLLIAAPLLSLVVVISLAVISEQLFWSMLAYLAIFHFMKQQIGFMKIYQRKCALPELHRWLTFERLTYFSMVMPIIYWHLLPNSTFRWFDGSSFITHYFDWTLSENLETVLSVGFNIIYWTVFGSAALLFFFHHRKNIRAFLPLLLWVGTTALNWYLGIVYFNSDVAFSITNIVAHGIPYLVLVIWYQWQKQRITSTDQVPITKILLSTISVILILALAEEYLWDTTVNATNNIFFLPALMDMFHDPWLRALAIGCLSVPQVTHYIIDGYIWKANRKNPLLKPIIFGTR